MIEIGMELSTYADTLRQAMAIIQALEPGGAPKTEKAIGESGDIIMQEWLNQADQAFAHPSGEYIRGIMEGMIYPYGDDNTVAVINQSPHAKFVEEGTSPFDMKKALLTSHNVRVSKDGNRYMIIPMKHQTPKAGAMADTMPKSVYSIAKNLVATQRVAAFKTPSIQTIGHSLKDRILAGNLERERLASRGSKGAAKSKSATNASGSPVANRSLYEWGGRVTGMGNLGQRTQLNSKLTIPGAVAQPVDYSWKSSPYENMYKMGGGQSNQTEYITFRTMSEVSPGWINPGIPAMRVAEKVANTLAIKLHERVDEAWMEDIEDHMGQGVIG